MEYNDYLLFGRDGSIRQKHLNQYVQQGDNDKSFAVIVTGIDNSANLLAEAVYTLPTRETVVGAGVWNEDDSLWVFTIPAAATNYSGSVLVAIRITNIDSGVIRVNYPFVLIINETGVQPETDTGITLEELDDFIEALAGSLNLKNGHSEGSIEQRSVNAYPADTHFKQPTAVGKNSIAFGNGDEYEYVWSVSNNYLTLPADNPVDINWLNRVLKYNDEYKRIVEIDTDTNTIRLESTLSVLSGLIRASVVRSVALGTNSYVCGNYCQAFGEASKAEGADTKAIGTASHTEGIGTVAGYNYQTVVGKYNDNKADTLFEVGNGTSLSHSNAFEVSSDGTAKVGAMGNDNLSVATKQYVDTKGSKLYTHHFDIVLTDNDLDMLPSGYAVSINVNALSNDPNEWETLSELDGKGYIISAFGTISVPATDYSYIFELKIFYSALNNGTLLINVNTIATGTVSCITVSNKNDFALEDSVSAVN